MADDAQPVHDPTVYDPAALTPEADRASRRRARKWWWALGAFLVVGILAIGYLGRQSESDAPEAPKAFCKAAEAYEDEIDRQAADYELDVDRQIEKVEQIAATAPKAIAPDAEVFLQSLRDYAAAPDQATRAALQDDPEVKEAVDNVNRYWNQGCDVFRRDSPL